MNKDDIKKALESCVTYKNVDCNNCPCCPYDGQILCQDVLCKDALNLITEQEKKIEQLTEERNRYAETLAKYQMASDKEIRAQIKQAKIDVLNKLKDYVNQLACDEYGDSACDTNYITIDIDKYEQDIDEMIAEVQNAEYKS